MFAGLFGFSKEFPAFVFLQGHTDMTFMIKIFCGLLFSGVAVGGLVGLVTMFESNGAAKAELEWLAAANAHNADERTAAEQRAQFAAAREQVAIDELSAQKLRLATIVGQLEMREKAGEGTKCPIDCMVDWQ